MHHTREEELDPTMRNRRLRFRTKATKPFIEVTIPAYQNPDTHPCLVLHRRMVIGRGWGGVQSDWTWRLPFDAPSFPSISLGAMMTPGPHYYSCVPGRWPCREAVITSNILPSEQMLSSYSSYSSYNPPWSMRLTTDAFPAGAA